MAESRPLAELLAAAAQAVAAVREGRSPTEVLEAQPPERRAGAQALAFEALRGLGRAEALRQRLVPRPPPAAADALLLTALALGAPGAASGYPAHTLVSQAVDAAKRVVPHQAGLINAVLRRQAREAEALEAALADDPVARWNHPRWWIERLRQDWPQDWQALLEANQQPGPMTLRVNRRRCTVPDYLAALAAAGLEALPLGSVAPDGVQLRRPVPVGQLPGWAEGWVSVQDASAQRAAPLLLGPAGLPRGARVLDACAAPGGKTAHLLEAAELDVLALDADAQRLTRVADSLQRLGLKARLQAADARAPGRWWDGRPFDAILLDAPCSASGIVRRHPDVRWLRRPGDLAQLARVQGELLDALWPLLAPGGRLVYATCSVFRAEGGAVIDAFLQRCPLALRAEAPGALGPRADNEATRSDGVPAPGDGFFYARLDRA